MGNHLKIWYFQGKIENFKGFVAKYGWDMSPCPYMFRRPWLYQVYSHVSFTTASCSKSLYLDMDYSRRINIKVCGLYCGYDGLTAVLKPYSNFGLTMALITVSATGPSLENCHNDTFKFLSLVDKMTALAGLQNIIMSV